MASVATPAEAETWACPKCAKGGFKSQGAVRIHYIAKGHDLHCPICNSNFSTAKSFIAHHVKQHLNPNKSSLPTTQTRVKTAASLPKKQLAHANSLVEQMERVSIQASDPKHQPPSQRQPRRSATKKAQFDQQLDKMPNGMPDEMPNGMPDEMPDEMPDGLPKQPVVKAPSQKVPQRKPRPQQNHSNSPVSQKRIFPHPLPARPTMDYARQDMPHRVNQSLQERPQHLYPRAPSSKAPHLAKALPVSVSVAVVEETSTSLYQSQSIHRHVILQAQEQDILFQELWTRCHSPQLLVAEGYNLGVFSLPKNIVEVKIPKRIPRKTSEKKGPSHEPVIPTTSFVATPQQLPNQSAKRRRAVVLDCEMVQVAGNFRELAYLTAVDFLTKEILIDNYVQPTKKVWAWNTRYSGISCAEMNRARAEGRALNGWHHARQVLWEYVDADTVLMGHSLQNDLKVLGFYHSKIVDSQILTSEAVSTLLPPNFTLTRRWGLKTLAKELLGDDIQVGRKGHSALEDTLATRDVVIWCLRNPEPLKLWAERNQDEEVRKILEARRKAEERRKKKLEEERKQEEEAAKIIQSITDQMQGSTARET